MRGLLRAHDARRHGLCVARRLVAMLPRRVLLGSSRRALGLGLILQCERRVIVVSMRVGRGRGHESGHESGRSSEHKSGHEGGRENAMRVAVALVVNSA